MLVWIICNFLLSSLCFPCVSVYRYVRFHSKLPLAHSFLSFIVVYNLIFSTSTNPVFICVIIMIPWFFNFNRCCSWTSTNSSPLLCPLMLHQYTIQSKKQNTFSHNKRSSLYSLLCLFVLYHGTLEINSVKKANKNQHIQYFK